jgi:hypothetical protein
MRCGGGEGETETDGGDGDGVRQRREVARAQWQRGGKTPTGDKSEVAVLSVDGHVTCTRLAAHFALRNVHVCTVTSSVLDQ